MRSFVQVVAMTLNIIKLQWRTLRPCPISLVSLAFIVIHCRGEVKLMYHSQVIPGCDLWAVFCSICSFWKLKQNIRPCYWPPRWLLSFIIGPQLDVIPLLLYSKKMFLKLWNKIFKPRGNCWIIRRWFSWVEFVVNAPCLNGTFITLL